MPSTSSVDRPVDAVSVANQYYRRARPLTVLVAVAVAGIVAVGYLFLPLSQWLLLSVVAVGLVRVPLFTTAGALRLSTAQSPEAVRADFESATPPVLAFQWGLTEAVEATERGGRYEIAYLFGLRSVTMEVDCRPTPDADTDLELVVTADGAPWGRYAVTLGEAVERDDSEKTVVDIDVQSERRFGLRRLPQRLVANRYRDAALDAQGYTVVERNASMSLV